MLSINKKNLFRVFLILATLLSQNSFPANITVNVSQDQGGQTLKNIAKNESNNNVTSSTSSNAIHILKAIIEKCKTEKDNFLLFASMHKYKLIGTTIGIFYLYILHKIQRYKDVMGNPRSWCCWKSSIETTELTALPHSKIYKQIIEDIQRKYLINQNGIQFFDSFNEFIRDIKYETEIIQAYINLHHQVTRYHLQSIFLIKPELLEVAQEKLQRAMFIYNTFVTWHTNRNIDQPA